MNYCYRTHPGMIRSDNEDSVLTYYEDPVGLYLVADGIGGYAGGKMASEIAVNTVFNEVKKKIIHLLNTNTIDRDNPDSKTVYNIIYDALVIADNKIKRSGEHCRALFKMGTTIVVALLIKKNDLKNNSTEPSFNVFISNMGDSRAYLISKVTQQKNENRPKNEDDETYTIVQLTQDNLLDSPTRPSHDDLHYKTDHNTDRNQDTNKPIIGYLGRYNEYIVESQGIGLDQYLPFFGRYQMFTDDYLLLSTDGLTTMLKNQEICNIISNHKLNDSLEHFKISSKQNLENICNALVNDALKKGGFDNVTIVLSKPKI